MIPVKRSSSRYTSTPRVWSDERVRGVPRAAAESGARRRCELINPADPEPQPQPTGDEREPDYRFTLANERTFLAWIRTALALIAGGVALVHLVPAFGIPGGRHALSVLLTAGGGLLAALAVRRRQRVQAAMRRDADLSPTRLPVLLGSALLAVTILVLVVLLVPPSMGP